MVISFKLMLATLIIIIAGNDTEVDLQDLVSIVEAELAEVAQSLRGREDEVVRFPKESSALGIHGFVCCQKVNGDLVTSLLLFVGQMLSRSSTQRVDDWVITLHGEFENSQEDFSG